MRIDWPAELEELARTPPQAPRKLLTGAYAENPRSFWESAIPKTRLTPSNKSDEPLINGNKLGLKADDYYHNLLRKAPYCEHALARLARSFTTRYAWVRESVAADLVTVDEFLRPHGFRLEILSGYRHPELQRLIRQGTSELSNHADAHSLLADPSLYAPHATGGAIDVEVWSVSLGRRVNSKVTGLWGRFDLEERAVLSQAESDARAARRVVHNLLCTSFLLTEHQQFIPHPFEYWHYGRHERLATFFERAEGREHPAFYDEIRTIPGEDV